MNSWHTRNKQTTSVSLKKLSIVWLHLRENSFIIAINLKVLYFKEEKSSIKRIIQYSLCNQSYYFIISSIRWSGVSCHAPHAASELCASWTQSSPSRPPAACLLVPWRPPHALLLPALPSNGVNGEPQPRPAQNGPEQREVRPKESFFFLLAKPTVSSLQSTLINTWWPIYMHVKSERSSSLKGLLEVVIIWWDCEDLLKSSPQ